MLSRVLLLVLPTKQNVRTSIKESNITLMILPTLLLIAFFFLTIIVIHLFSLNCSFCTSIWYAEKYVPRKRTHLLIRSSVFMLDLFITMTVFHLEALCVEHAFLFSLDSVSNLRRCLKWSSMNNGRQGERVAGEVRFHHLSVKHLTSRICPESCMHALHAGEMQLISICTVLFAQATRWATEAPMAWTQGYFPATQVNIQRLLQNQVMWRSAKQMGHLACVAGTSAFVFSKVFFKVIRFSSSTKQTIDYSSDLETSGSCYVCLSLKFGLRIKCMFLLSCISLMV